MSRNTKNNLTPAKQLLLLTFIAFAIVPAITSAAAVSLAPITLLDMKIKEAGIPIHGLSGWPVQRIDFKEEATQGQQQQAWDMVNSFDEGKELEKNKTREEFLENASQEATTLSLMNKIKNGIAAFGLSVKDSMVKIFSLAVEKLFAKTARIERLEVIDKQTGDIYCSWIENGEWQKEKGECDALEAGPVIEEPPASPPAAPEPVNEPPAPETPAPEVPEIPPAVEPEPIPEPPAPAPAPAPEPPAPEPSESSQ